GVAVRSVLRAVEEDHKTCCAAATSCLEVSSFLYPFTAWQESFIHSAFENVAATIAGAEAAYNVLKRKGKIEDTYKFIAFAGDGGTYDIGFQSLSGAMERGHDMVYVCYDNEAYMNTGIQRSSSTPKFAEVSTAPVGSVLPGKMQYKKDLTGVMVAHNIPYVAQTTFTANFKDLHEKSKAAIYTPGPAFLNVLAPCPRGWRYPPEDLMDICKLAIDTCIWPLYEVVEGEWRLTYEPKKKLPVEDYFRPQGRFSHMFKPGAEWMLEDAQNYIDKKWDDLLSKCK
ncbi:MAG: thiamine pyrophosphate-dependent enzyme, partial [Oscillospiraceae bacterium]|nr:thiamine pyrophosphate-dependent enzyme [Oscillospiraceae bacterium]